MDWESEGMCRCYEYYIYTDAHRLAICQKKQAVRAEAALRTALRGSQVASRWEIGLEDMMSI